MKPRLKSWRLGSVASNVLLPWLLLLLLAFALTGYRFQQSTVAEAMEAHNALHRRAVLLATQLRFMAQERWSNALAYETTRDPQQLVELKKSQIVTGRAIEALEHLFADGDVRHSRDLKNTADQAQALLHGYRAIRVEHIRLYDQFIDAIHAEDVDHQTKLISLLSDKVLLVRAALDDLAAYHIKTEQSVVAEQQAMLRHADQIFFGLLVTLILAGLVLSRFQTLAIVHPLNDLTLAARKIAAGEPADFSQFKGKGEIGELGNAFAQMVSALQETHNELSAQKDQLALAYAEVEDKVKRRTAELSRRSEELEVANKDLEGFSYSVSHDLRAPLRAIDGFIGILKEDYGPTLDAEASRLFGIVGDNARKMGQLIDDILAFSRAGRLELERTHVDMNSLVDEIWLELSAQQTGRVVEFSRGDLPAVFGDPRALRQVWQNLLDNAFKFTRDRNPAQIEVSAHQKDGLIWFSIQDNGAGFNENYGHKLFGLFLRLHGMEEFDGTGVGLAIVKRFVQKHGGEVAAEGQVGAGATFRFSLPANTVGHIAAKG